MLPSSLPATPSVELSEIPVLSLAELLPPRRRSLAAVIALLWMCQAFGQPAGPNGEDEDRRQMESFLTDESPQAFEILSRNPRLLGERPVQAKIYRAQRSQDPELRRQAFGLCFGVPDLNTLAPLIDRRCENSFIGNDVTPKKVFLQLFLERPGLLDDLRVTGLVSAALRSADDELANLARTAVEKYPALAQNPAVLATLSGETSGLPSAELFAELVDPVFMATGPDGKSCLDCHHSRPVLFLPHPGPQDDADRIRHERYYSSLRVINLSDPEKSLLLTKPTLPQPADAEGPSDSDHHSGGPRFRKGDPAYESLLRWIRSAETRTDAQSARKQIR